jgi:hypothetical protein
MPDSAWSLHPQLEHDTAPVGDLPLCRVLAIDDADYPCEFVTTRIGALRTDLNNVFLLATACVWQ